MYIDLTLPMNGLWVTFFHNQMLLWYFLLSPFLGSLSLHPKRITAALGGKNQLIFLFVKCSPYHMDRVIAWRNDIHQDTSPFSRDDSGYQSLESLVTTWHWKRSENGSLGKKSRRVLGNGENEPSRTEQFISRLLQKRSL